MACIVHVVSLGLCLVWSHQECTVQRSVFMRPATITVHLAPVALVPGATAEQRVRRQKRGIFGVLVIVMVLGTLLQFLKNVCVLVVGLLRLSYRRVGLQTLILYDLSSSVRLGYGLL